MNKEKLDITSLKNALNAFSISLNVYKRLVHGDTPDDERNVLQSGVIHAFEYLYELCWKFMRRWLNLNVTPGIADGITRRELFRLSVENQLIADVSQWMAFHQARNETSHTYDQNIAEEVFEQSWAFLSCVQDYVGRLEQKI
ncbi:nucleotidyltransferase substrate binding protein [Desulfosarcina sp. OttesenSCG-928-G17]|nr:nucleotidyltransferase substrate binding protein [Desulfosarcina sp. OttesenSCG-928-G17]